MPNWYDPFVPQAMFGSLAPEQRKQYAMDQIGDIGMGMLANAHQKPLQAFGQAAQNAQNNGMNNAYKGALMQSMAGQGQDALRQQEELRQKRLNLKNWAVANTGKHPAAKAYLEGVIDDDQVSKAIADTFSGNKGLTVSEQLSALNQFSDQPAVKFVNEATPILNSMGQSINDDRAVPDLDFIYGTAKMLDPSGRVTDQDAQMQMVQQSLPKQWAAAIQQAFEGKGRLGPEVRKAMYDLGRRRLEAYHKQAEGNRGFYSQTFPTFQFPQVPQAAPEPAMPQQGGSQQSIPQGAVQMLKQNPALAEQFDQKYGPGSAQRVLQGGM